MPKRRLAVLGGGMGSLSAVYWITSDPQWQEKFDITVYQLGWRLGGKAASARHKSICDRSQEHGFHILLGFYDNVFATMRRCYRELGRPPGSPMSEFVAPTTEDEQAHPERYAALRHYDVQIAQQFAGETHYLPFNLPANDLIPSDGTKVDLWASLSFVFDLMVRGAEGTVFAMGHEPAHPDRRPDITTFEKLRGEAEKICKRIETGVDRLVSQPFPMHAAHELWKKLVAGRGVDRIESGIEDLIVALVKVHIRNLWQRLQPTIASDWSSYLDWIVQDTMAANVCGILTDRLLTRGLDTANDRNYIDWWMSHAAVPDGAQITAASTLGQFPFDLVFGFRKGDTTSPAGPGKPYRGSPNMEAGTMLRGLFHFLLAYKGAPEWLPQAGFAEVLVTPMYQVLQRRGVRFEFFQKVKALHLDRDGRKVARIEMERQATTKSGAYQPLVSVKNLECWPRQPLFDQLVEGEQLKQRNIDLESWWTSWKGKPWELQLGAEGEAGFDEVLLGISIAALPEMCSELRQANPKWRDMLANIETNRPMVAQVWFNRSMEEMGWPHGAINGDIGTEPVNLQTSMDQIIGKENWGDAPPKALVYYSGVIPDDPHQPAPPDENYPSEQHEALRKTMIDFLSRSGQVYFPDLKSGETFDWNALACPSKPGLTGPERFNEQYWRVNIDPSERYVLSVTGSSKYRMDAGSSGFDNLYLTGDWIRTGINSGCMEGTFTAGLAASRAISGGPARVDGERDWLVEAAQAAAVKS